MLTFDPIFLSFMAMIACGWLNAIRGGGQGWMRPVVGLAAGLFAFAAGETLHGSGIIAAGIWLWLTQPWGRWYMIGAGERDWSNGANAWEAPIERFADRVFPNHRSRADALA